MLGRIDPETLFAPLEGVGPLVLAVSGGPDSMALMHLAVRWPRRPALCVATIDHGLRPEARAEAEQVAAWARQTGLEHHLLVWLGEKPRARIQEKAREARYSLLVDHARRIGAAGIVTGHHADDQAETILLRLTRGSGVAGLAGMRLHTLRAGLSHWRPLLEVPKATLIDYCLALGQGFFEDPANHNPAFARARLRAKSAELERLGLGRANLLRLGARAARADEALKQAADAFRAAWPTTRGDNAFSAAAAPLLALADEIALRVIGDEIADTIGGPIPIRLERLERLWTALRPALANGQPMRATLGGAVIHLDAVGRLNIRPEAPRQRGRTTKDA